MIIFFLKDTDMIMHRMGIISIANDQHINSRAQLFGIPHKLALLFEM